MASSDTIIILSDIATFVISAGSSMFIAGTRWGEIRSDVSTIKERMARIEGMFTLKLRREYDDSRVE